jgi:hypothetical protein
MSTRVDPADRQDIVETCTRVAWHADHREWDALAAVFADRVEVDYTSLNGGDTVTLSGAQIAEGWSGVLGAFVTTQHLITNHLVTVDGDDAVCTAAFQATHRLTDPYGAGLWTLGGDYRFALRRTDGAWRITAITMTATWGDGNRNLFALANG